MIRVLTNAMIVADAGIMKLQLFNGHSKETSIESETHHSTGISKMPPGRLCEVLPACAAQTLDCFVRRYSEGRHPIHFVKVLEKTNGF